MKQILIFITFLVCNGLLFSQAKITYTQNLDNTFTKETIVNANFKEFDNPINNGLKNGVYWFKIAPNNNVPFAIQIHNYHVFDVVAYQKNIVLEQEKHERFVTYKIKNNDVVYVKVNATKEALIPIKIDTLNGFEFKEKKNFLFIGFYYGFAFIVVLINLFYYVNFSEDTFLYYALFLFTISFGLLISDGLLHFYNVSLPLIDVLQVIDHCVVVLFSVLFAYSYLQIQIHYPKIKWISSLFVLCVFAFGMLYLITKNFVFYTIMESLVFITFIYLWSIGVSLIKKNVFTKIFVLAYFFILILGILFYITKLFGLPKIGASQLKLGGFIEMIFLSFAVIYRMKILQLENNTMRNEIILYAKEIKQLSIKLQNSEENTFKDANLSNREESVLQLITEGKTNKQISEALNISINTVKYHLKNIYDKLDIKNRKEAKKMAIKL